jgi:hypothetical protein
MKNPLQKRVHIPQNPQAMMMKAAQEKSQQEQKELREKAERVLLPLFLKKSENILDAVVWANTLSQKVQELAAERAVSMKVSDYEKELRTQTTAKHGERYDELVDVLKDMQVKEAVTLLAQIKSIINASIDNKLSKVKLDEFVERKSNIILDGKKEG